MLTLDLRWLPSFFLMLAADMVSDVPQTVCSFEVNCRIESWVSVYTAYSTPDLDCLLLCLYVLMRREGIHFPNYWEQFLYNSLCMFQDIVTHCIFFYMTVSPSLKLIKFSAVSTCILIFRAHKALQFQRLLEMSWRYHEYFINFLSLLCIFDMYV